MVKIGAVKFGWPEVVEYSGVMVLIAAIYHVFGADAALLGGAAYVAICAFSVAIQLRNND